MSEIWPVLPPRHILPPAALNLSGRSIVATKPAEPPSAKDVAGASLYEKEVYEAYSEHLVIFQ